ncbi:DUF2637 domain-containing protein [Frankia sp. Cas4]|uniref:DUF2637 domain-containing protein n=1 Tax=Frankia sp. Cas4 TaxID=3073927 RepID=UPI002AD2DC30|nr:DUF2637 domain-containing protein [Frankia sp. Cas4]
MTTRIARRTLSGPLLLALVLVAGVWAAGAVWSFKEQSEFAHRLGFTIDWLLPAVADGLPVAMGAVAFSAAVDGRPATAARLGTALAVGGSVASNGLNAWSRTGGDLKTVIVACAVPTLAGIAFEVLLGELRKQVLSARGEISRRTRLEPVPPLRPIRVLLDPVREIGQWRRHVLAVTDPAADSTSRAALSRLADAVAEIGAQREAPADDEPRETFEAPVWSTPALTTSVPRKTSRPVGSETTRTETPALTAPVPSETSRSAPSERARSVRSQRSEMRAWAQSQLDAGVPITGADLDRQFGTRTVGRVVLRELRAAQAQQQDAAAVPALAGVGVSGA